MNVYYSPEYYNLETVAEFNFMDEPWEFDIGVVWFNARLESYYYAHDAGCSCPEPFEDVDFNQLEPLNFAQVITRINEDVKNSYNVSYATGESLQAIETLMRYERNRK